MPALRVVPGDAGPDRMLAQQGVELCHDTRAVPGCGAVDHRGKRGLRLAQGFDVGLAYTLAQPGPLGQQLAHGLDIADGVVDEFHRSFGVSITIHLCILPPITTVMTTDRVCHLPMVVRVVNWEQLQRSWDAQQESYLPDRETRFATMLDLVAATAGPSPRVLDLAGGTGSITRRLLTALPGASAVLLDVDPVLLAIASATFADDKRVVIARADLNDPEWARCIPAGQGPFDAVLTATALHWLSPSRVAALYAEVRSVLRPGGVFGNADHMPDPGLTELSARLAETINHRAAAQRRAGNTPDWEQWWAQAREVAELAAPFAARDNTPRASHTRSSASSAWHVAALDDAGFHETGLVWRGHSDALVVGVHR